MGFKQASPGEGPGRGHAHHRYVGTVPGRKWCAWIAGPCVWVLAHTKGRSKPCVDWMTDSAVPCKRCASTTPPVVIGYLPLYRQVDAAPVMVIVYEDVRHVVDVLRLHQRVEIAREGQQGDAVSVTPLLTREPVYQTTIPQRLRPVDLTDCLLALWSLPELTAWYRCQPAASDTALSLAKDPPTQTDGASVGPMYRAAAERYGSGGPVPPVAGVEYEELLARMKERAAVLKPSKNGKHPKPTE